MWRDSLWVLLAVAMLNVALGVWLRRFGGRTGIVDGEKSVIAVKQSRGQVYGSSDRPPIASG